MSAANAMNEVLRKINSLKDKSTERKIVLLREYIRHDEVFKKIIIYATSDTMQFGMTRLPEFRHNDLKIKKKELIIKKIFDQLDFLSKNKGTIQEKQYLSKLAEKIPNGKNIINRILIKNLSCGVSSRIVNKAVPGLVDCIPDKKIYSESNITRINFPAYCEEDKAGIIINALVQGGTVRYISRKGHTYNIKNNQLKNEILNISNGVDIALIGVCTTGKNYFADMRKILKEKADQDIHDKVVMFVSEIMPLSDFQNFKCKVELKSRYESKLFSKLNDCKYLKTSKRKIVNSYKEAIQMSNDAIKNGENGVIVKDFKSFWEEVNIGSWASIRKPVECILKIVFYDIDGRMLYCESKDSFIKSIIINGLENIKNEDLLLSIGRCCKVQFAELLFKPGKVARSLFNPRFVGFSSDDPNTLSEVKEMEIKIKQRKKYDKS